MTVSSEYQYFLLLVVVLVNRYTLNVKHLAHCIEKYKL